MFVRQPVQCSPTSMPQGVKGLLLLNGNRGRPLGQTPPPARVRVAFYVGYTTALEKPQLVQRRTLIADEVMSA